ncbi:imidazole glycerol phosphate synthase subunit HisH [Microbacterium sp. CJ88]|uniref:imidazole glycerol phosphate synthase subunit HisH n=1 Tax=Microbacterium sp. CJ88 TaxID=3445672 RepID=UPI003F655694
MTRPDVTVVDYGVGNLGSLRNALAKVGHTAEITGDPEIVAAADRVILPGVGAFDRAVERLSESGLGDAVRTAAGRGIPVAGVCLGMQLLMDGSEEGERPGLGLIGGRAHRFPSSIDGARLLVPHMGWSAAVAAKPSRIAPALSSGGRYYFVHSYAVDVDDPADVLTWTDYGRRYASSVERDNVLGIQFHPEKSHRFGLAILRDFAGASL